MAEAAEADAAVAAVDVVAEAAVAAADVTDVAAAVAAADIVVGDAGAIFVSQRRAATSASVSKYCAMVLPMTLAVAPSATKTVVKPRTKASAEKSTARRCAAPGCSSLS